MGTRLSAFCTSWPADRIPPGNLALVGSLAEGRRYGRDGRTYAACVDDGKCEAGDSPRDVAGPLDCRAFVATANCNTPAAVPNRSGTTRDKRVFDGSGRLFTADAWQVFGGVGSIRSRTRSGRRPTRGRRPLADFRDAATRSADRDPWRPGGHARCRVRPADCQSGRAAV